MYHEMTYRVPYADTDRMGVVYHANYLVYFERGRNEMLREAGLPYSEMERRGVIFPVSEAFCRYHAPARYDDLLTFRTWISEIRGARIKISSNVFCDGKLLVSGHIILASVTSELKITRLPAEIVEVCKKFIWNEEETEK